MKSRRVTASAVMSERISTTTTSSMRVKPRRRRKDLVRNVGIEAFPAFLAVRAGAHQDVGPGALFPSTINQLAVPGVHGRLPQVPARRVEIRIHPLGSGREVFQGIRIPL